MEDTEYVLFNVCKRGDIEKFLECIERFECYNLSLNGALYGACIGGTYGGTYDTEQERNTRMELVKIIIEKGNQCAYEFDYKQGLYNACRSCNIDLVKLMLQKGSLKGTSLNNGLNAACFAYEVEYESDKRYLDIIKLLIENGATFKESYNIYCYAFFIEHKRKQLLGTKLNENLINYTLTKF